MRASEEIRDFIKRREDETAYLSDATSFSTYVDDTGHLTIGWGHTGADVRKGKTITRAEADALFDADVSEIERSLNKSLPLFKFITQGMFDAFVSFSFNAGLGNLKTSTMWRESQKATSRDEHFQKAADAFLLWNKGTVKGKKVPLAGLTKRRKWEREFYLKGE